MNDLFPDWRANIFPPMDENALAELTVDIEKSNYQSCVNGSHRFQACYRLGIEPKTRTFDGTDADALSFVVSANLARRHIQRAAKVCKDAPELIEKVQAGEISLSKAARQAGVPRGMDAIALMNEPRFSQRKPVETPAPKISAETTANLKHHRGTIKAWLLQYKNASVTAVIFVLQDAIEVINQHLQG